MKLNLSVRLVLVFTVFLSCSENIPNDLNQLPEVLTSEITGISASSAIGGGSIISDGGATVVARGICWSILPSPTIADSKTTDGQGGGTFVSSITGLSPNSSYFVRAYATNSKGTSYGLSLSITTKDGLIALSTVGALEITALSAKSGGVITSDGGSRVTMRGVCWSTKINPTTQNSKTSDGDGIGNFVSQITSLAPKTSFYIRAYATNETGTYYGNQESITTLPYYHPGSGVTDIDGHFYESVIIGNQEWLTSNLRTSKYLNGDLISNETTGTNWENTTSAAWSNYANSSQNDNVYGKLYNWPAVIDSRKLCPSGWHVPSDAEWTDLVDYLGGFTAAPNKLKSTSNLWQINTGASNESGFSALPGGFRWSFGDFYDLGVSTGWWSATEKNSSEAWQRYLVSTSIENLVYRASNTKNYGYYCRCVKD